MFAGNQKVYSESSLKEATFTVQILTGLSLEEYFSDFFWITDFLKQGNSFPSKGRV